MSVTIDETVNGKSLISTTRLNDASDTAGNTNVTEEISYARGLETAIVAMDTGDNRITVQSHERASAAPFVAVNTVVNIPAGLLPGSNPCTSANVNICAPSSVNLRAPMNEDCSGPL